MQMLLELVLNTLYSLVVNVSDEYKCTQVHRIESLERRGDDLLEAFKSMADKFDAKLDVIIYQMNKIAILEVEHSNHKTSLSRAFDQIEDLTKVVATLTSYKDKAEGMTRMAWILWSAMGVSITTLIIKIFG